MATYGARCWWVVCRWRAVGRLFARGVYRFGGLVPLRLFGVDVDKEPFIVLLVPYRFP